MTDESLPAAFADLAAVAALWGLPTENARSDKRWRSTPDEYRAMYDAV